MLFAYFIAIFFYFYNTTFRLSISAPLKLKIYCFTWLLISLIRTLPAIYRRLHKPQISMIFHYCRRLEEIKSTCFLFLFVDYFFGVGSTQYNLYLPRFADGRKSNGTVRTSTAYQATRAKTTATTKPAATATSQKSTRSTCLFGTSQNWCFI